MHRNSLLQSFALDSEGRLRSIEDVGRGLTCQCTCPQCHLPVLAKQGTRREWHFAHAPGSECAQGAETALHQASKQLLVEAGGLMLPSQAFEAEICLGSGRVDRGRAERPAYWVDFADAQQERLIQGVRPDVLAIVGSRILAIEVAVTHFVDEHKAGRLRSLQLPALEIDLSVYRTQLWGWDELRLAIINHTHNKRWICQIEQQILEVEARVAAARQLGQKSAQKNFRYGKPARTRFHVRGRIVDLIELPFGVALWSPYDPDFNAFIKQLVYRLGGRWQPKFKNWLIPLGAKPSLEAELVAMSVNGEKT